MAFRLKDRPSRRICVRASASPHSDSAIVLWLLQKFLDLMEGEAWEILLVVLVEASLS